MQTFDSDNINSNRSIGRYCGANFQVSTVAARF